MSMNPSIIKYRIRFLDVNIEKSFLCDKIKTVLSDKDLQNSGSDRLTLRQRQTKVDDINKVSITKDNNDYTETDITESFHIFRGDVEKPILV